MSPAPIRRRDPFVAAAARGLEPLDPPSHLVLAVSGGADSVALLHALAAARDRKRLKSLRFSVGHVNHQLRPEATAEAALVEAHARRLGLPFGSRTVDVRPGKGGLEEAARNARYAALVEIARAIGAGGVVTGHTATDQAETLLLRLVRGTGLHGLGGMAPSRGLGGLVLLRPLLGVTREETRAYCERNQLEFRDDPTNVNLRPRARIRAEVLPVLERLQPGAALRLSRAADRLRLDDGVLDIEEGIADVATLEALPSPLRRRALSRIGSDLEGVVRPLASSHIEALEKLVLTGRGEVLLPGDGVTHRVAIIEDGVVRVGSRRSVKKHEPGPR